MSIASVVLALAFGEGESARYAFCTFAALMLLEWSWDQTVEHPIWGVDTDELLREFFRTGPAIARCALGVLLSISAALLNALGASDETLAGALVGAVVISGIVGVENIFRSRKRILERR